MTIEEFIGGDAKEIPINDAHATQTPIFGILLNQPIDFLQSAKNASHNLLCELISARAG